MSGLTLLLTVLKTDSVLRDLGMPPRRQQSPWEHSRSVLLGGLYRQVPRPSEMMNIENTRRYDVDTPLFGCPCHGMQGDRARQLGHKHLERWIDEVTEHFVKFNERNSPGSIVTTIPAFNLNSSNLSKCELQTREQLTVHYGRNVSIREDLWKNWFMSRKLIQHHVPIPIG